MAGFEPCEPNSAATPANIWDENMGGGSMLGVCTGFYITNSSISASWMWSLIMNPRNMFGFNL